MILWMRCLTFTVLLILKAILSRCKFGINKIMPKNLTDFLLFSQILLKFIGYFYRECQMNIIITLILCSTLLFICQ